MGLSLIERYVFYKVMAALFVAAGALIGVVWVVRAVQQVDVVMTKGQGIWAYLQITSLGVPTLAASIAPIALLIAFAQTINTLNNDSELVVMHASGASRASLIKPFLAAGLLTSMLVYFLALWAGPASMLTLRGYITTMRTDLISIAVQEGTFRDIGSGMTIHVANRAPGGTLKGVFILDGRSEKETFTYLAEEGDISKVDGQAYLVLKRGVIQRLPRGSDDLSIIKFNSYAFNLSSFSGGKAGSSGSQMELSTGQLFSPDKDNAFYNRYPGRYRAELHTRLTSGLYPIATVFVIAAFFGFPQSNRQSQLTAGVVSSLIVVGLRVFGVVAEGALRQQPEMVYVVWGLPLLGIVIPLLIIMSGRSIQLPAPMQARVDLAAAWVEGKVLSLRKRFFPGSVPFDEAAT